MFSLKILLNTELFGIWKAIIIPSLENFLFNFELKMHKKKKTFDSLAVGSRVRYYMRGVSIPILISTVTSWLTFFVHNIKFSSVQFSHLVMSDSLWPHGLQHTKPPCPPPAPGAYSNSCPLSDVHGDAIESSHPLSSPSPPAFNLSQHQGLFKWVSSSHQVAKVLEFLLQHQSFQWIFRIDFL